jgi:hypothetical protein
MSEDAASHQPVSINLATFSTAFNVIQSNGRCPQNLSAEGNRETPERGHIIIGKDGLHFENQQQVNYREKPIPVMKNKIADANHHFTAMIPQKLYHLKKTSQ